MAAFLTYLSFGTPPYDIPDPNKLRDAFNLFCGNVQDEVLEKILGYELWKEFNAAQPIVDGSEEKWKDLTNGAEYSFEGKTYKWKGMASLLIPYTHKEWILSRTELLSNVGMIKGKPENSVPQTDVRKLAKSDIAFRKLLGDECNQEGTFYGFMKVNSADYPTWVFTQPSKINAMGI